MLRDLVKYCLYLIAFLPEIISQDCKAIGAYQCNLCANRLLSCRSISSDEALSDTFKNISKTATESQKHFRELYLTFSSFKQLSTNIVLDTTFEKIDINNCNQLESIDKDAFIGTNYVTKYFYLSELAKLKSTNNSIFESLSTFTNIENIYILNTNISEIPSNAFQPLEGNQDKLTSIYLGGKSFKKIGSNAFSALSNLNKLTFYDIQFDEIPDYAFAIDSQSNSPISIEFSSCLKLNQTSFSEYSLLNIRRPTNLTLNSEFRYLSEKIFLPFLMENEKNNLSLKYDYFDCDDCKNYWIKKHWKDYRNRFPGIKCSNGRDIDNYENFAGCEFAFAKIISPCVYSNETIICGGISHFDLEHIFTNFSSKLSEDKKHFPKFYLNNTAIKELANNTFKDITFDEISIEECVNLVTINRNAFNTTNLVTKVLNVQNNHKLSSPDNSIWDILNSFSKSEKINFNFNNNINEIPSKAFKAHQDKLKELILHGSAFEKLGSNAFSSLINLVDLSFYAAKFKQMPPNAFTFENSSSQVLHLNLSYLPDIDSTSFDVNTFSNILRPTVINFKPATNKMTYLSEKVFANFLLSNEKNSIDFHFDRIDCNDCRNYWIKKEPKLQQRLFNIKCSNGNDLNDPANFHC